MPRTAVAPHRPCIPPEINADVILSVGHAKPANREKAGETPSTVIWRPHAVLLSMNQSNMQRAMATRSEAFKGEGFNIEGRRAPRGINGVANRFSVWLLAGPLIKPSINGMIAADAINEVKRKSALRRILSTADKSAIKPDSKNAAQSARNTAGIAAPRDNSPKLASNIALAKPPR